MSKKKEKSAEDLNTYVVVQADTAKAFDKLLNAYAEHGYKVIGSASITLYPDNSIMYTQIMEIAEIVVEQSYIPTPALSTMDPNK